MHKRQTEKDPQDPALMFKPTATEKIIAHKVLLAYDFVCSPGGRTSKHVEYNIAHGLNESAGLHESGWVKERMAEMMTNEEKESLFGYFVLKVFTPAGFWNDLMILCYQIIGYTGGDAQTIVAQNWRELLIMSDPFLNALHTMNQQRLLELFNDEAK